MFGLWPLTLFYGGLSPRNNDTSVLLALTGLALLAGTNDETLAPEPLSLEESLFTGLSGLDGNTDLTGWDITPQERFASLFGLLGDFFLGGARHEPLTLPERRSPAADRALEDDDATPSSRTDRALGEDDRVLGSEPVRQESPPEPAAPAKPPEPAAPTAPPEPAAPANPPEPAAPTAPPEPVTPAKPPEPAAPTAPPEPVAPATAPEPAAPAKPTEPAAPTAPPEPVAPARPAKASNAVSTAEIAAVLPDHVTGQDRQLWAQSIEAQIKAAGMTPTPEIVSFVVATIEQESAFSVDPRIPDTQKLFDRVMRQYDQKFDAEIERMMGTGIMGSAAKTLAEPARAALKEFLKEIYVKYNFKDAKTEGQLEAKISEALKAEMPRLRKHPVLGKFPEKYFALAEEKARGVVGTKGSMQVDFDKAREIAKAEGTYTTDEALTAELYTRDGGVKYGVRQMGRYADAYANRDDLSAEEKFAFMAADYQGGEFSCRNARLQQIVSELTGEPLALDGDMLGYDQDTGQPTEAPSKTELAIRKWAKAAGHTWTDAEIRAMLLKEKTGEFEHTALYKALREAAAQKHAGEGGWRDAYAILPTGLKGDSEAAEVKWGKGVSNRGYSSKSGKRAAEIYKALTQNRQKPAA